MGEKSSKEQQQLHREEEGDKSRKNWPKSQSWVSSNLTAMRTKTKVNIDDLEKLPRVHRVQWRCLLRITTYVAILVIILIVVVVVFVVVVVVPMIKVFSPLYI